MLNSPDSLRNTFQAKLGQYRDRRRLENAQYAVLDSQTHVLMNNEDDKTSMQNKIQDYDTKTRVLQRQIEYNRKAEEYNSSFTPVMYYGLFATGLLAITSVVLTQ